MNHSRRVRGIELRYLLTMHLFQQGPATITELVRTLASQGFDVGGRASKSVSDALRWEIKRGRVHRLGRARYGPGWMPRGTEYRINQRVLALRAGSKGAQEAKRCRSEAGHGEQTPAEPR